MDIKTTITAKFFELTTKVQNQEILADNFLQPTITQRNKIMILIITTAAVVNNNITSSLLQNDDYKRMSSSLNKLLLFQ